VASGIPVGKHQ